MKLQDQVCSLELAKRLEELRVEQESLFYWEKDCERADDEWSVSCILWHDAETGEWGDCHELKNTKHFSAFTVAELGELIPYCLGGDNSNFLTYRRHFGDWAYEYANWPGEVYMSAKNEANARAKMLIYLIENKLIHT